MHAKYEKFFGWHGSKKTMGGPRFLDQSDEVLQKRFSEINRLESLRTEAAIKVNKPSNSALEHSLASGARNMERNRYVNVLPWDHNRVRLCNRASNDDYINASFIELQAPGLDPRAYVATQGPTSQTVSQFWEMVAGIGGMDKDGTAFPTVVVMLTRTHEGRREKCARYWPSGDLGAGESVFKNTEGDVKITVIPEGSVKVDNDASCEIRKFIVETTAEVGTGVDISHPVNDDNRSSNQNSARRKIVYHLFFDKWGDFDSPKPEHENNLLHLCKLANEINGGTSDSSRPLVVHCSAGVGRTGTFVTIDFLLSCMNAKSSPTASTKNSSDSMVPSASILYSKDEPSISSVNEDYDPIYDTVMCLRKQRMMMVQSVKQYLFIYDVFRRLLK
ncbi:protein-tyrosine phosphatase-like protein [Dipodascopsis uninucleata]